jgi:hypothetical protein
MSADHSPRWVSFGDANVDRLHDEDNIPVLLAYPLSARPWAWRVWCPYCRCWHEHGALAGPRVAHCTVDEHHDMSSPFAETGYYLLDAKNAQRFTTNGKHARKRSMWEQPTAAERERYRLTGADPFHQTR